MRAIVVHATGGPDVLHLDEAPRPAPGPGEVLIRVAAAGVNYADVGRRRGRTAVASPLPYIPGLEVAGVVVEVGEGVTDFAPGARVMGFTAGGGGYAEYVTAAPYLLMAMPEQMSFVDGAAFPMQAMTAYHVLRTMAQVQRGETVLVHAAAGGVGVIAVQLAKLMGADKVIATASSASKLDLARSLGADAGINYAEGPFAEKVLALTDGRGADVVLDAVGGDTFEQSLEALASFGRLVTYGNASGAARQFDPRRIMARNQAVMGYWLNQAGSRPDLHRQGVKELLEYREQGQLRLVIGGQYPLAEAARAHAELEGRASVGKLVLVMDGEEQGRRKGR